MTTNKNNKPAQASNQDIFQMKLSHITRHAMRFFEDDDKAITALRKSIAHVSDETFVDIVRKSVHAGLPIVIEQWKPIINEKE
jgi:hypothetical protein